MRFFFCLLALAVVVAQQSFGQKGFSVGPLPSWVEQPAFPSEVPDSADVAGYYYLGYDYQFNAEKKQGFAHYAIKVINDKGLSQASAIDRSYDPAYEKLAFHSLYIQRGSQKINHLERGTFEVIQREENLSRASYDGSLTAIATLKDVKEGDIVVYSYSITGYNPVFQGHIYKTFGFNFGSPTGRISYRLLVPPSKEMQFKVFGKVPEVKESVYNGLKSYRWELLNSQPTKSEDGTPDWYNPSNRIQITDFKSWDDLSKWSLDLFKVSNKRSAQLGSFIDSLKSLDGDEKRVVSAIRMVQDKVRYFSFVDGMSSYKPHDPSDVFGNKYGDCKDKSLLLSEILNSIGIESHPVLVSTQIGKVMNERLPAPGLFDHCIVQFKLKDSLHYIDPTITFQRGQLNNLVTPDYYFGLVADPDQPGLTPIAVGRAPSLIRAKEEYSFNSIGGKASLKVETFYSGQEADGVRDQFKSNLRSEIDQTYLDFYANDYPEIKLAKSIRHEDDTVNNIVTVFEEYEVPDFWKYDSAEHKYSAELYGRVVSAYLSKPSTKVRTTPYSVRYPLDVQLITNINLSESWNATEGSETVKGPGFVFTSKKTYNGDKLIRFQYNLNNTSDAVDAARTAEYLNQIDKIYNKLSYTLTYTPNETANTTPSNRLSFGVLILFVILEVGLYFVVLRLNEYDPRSRQVYDRYDRITSWLLLAAIGLIITPFRTLYTIADSFIMNSAVWDGIVNFNGNPGFSALLTMELIFNSIYFTLSCFCLYLFFRQRTSAPLFISIMLGFNCFMLIADGLFVTKLGLGQIDSKAVVYSIIATAIWIPVFMTSHLSKGTFTRRLDRDA